MELQAQLTALEEEVGMLKGEIKAILQEVRVAILARQNPFLVDDLDRHAPAAATGLFDLSEASVAAAPPSAPASPAPAEAAPQAIAAESSPRIVSLSDLGQLETDGTGAVLSARKRPVDLAALMVWVQECAESFSHTEFVMLVTMASYADFFDEGLKQALLDMSEQIAREHTTKASLADFSLALKKLEAIRATSGRQRQVA
jgi:hypothetical protein